MRKAFVGLVVVFLINVPSLYYGWYLKWGWVDIVLHFSGGFFVSMFMVDYLRNRLIPKEWIKNTLIIVGATIFIGVIWEFAEFIANQTLTNFVYNTFGVRAYFMGDLVDTVNDLLMDILGAFVFLSIFHRKQIEKLSEKSLS